MSKPKKPPPQVGIVWVPKTYDSKTDGDDIPVCVLTSYRGPRLYEKDKYDGRVDPERDHAKDGPIPYFEKVTEAFAWMVAHLGEPCQLPSHIVLELAR